MTTENGKDGPPDLPSMGAMAVQGVIFWLGFALFVRFMEPFGLLQGALRGVMFVIAVPISAALIAAIGKVMRYPAARLTEIIGIITAYAIVLDGLAFGFFPGLYGSDPAHQVAGAGLILFGGGIGMLAATLIQMRASR